MESSNTRDMRAIFHGGETACRDKILEREGGFIKRRKKSREDAGDNDN